MEIDDGSGEHLPGAHRFEDLIAANAPLARQETSEDDIYMLYTGGTTGMPKGVMYRQGDFSQGLAGAGLGPDAPRTAEAVLGAIRMLAEAKAAPISIAACPLMHGTGLWLGCFVPHILGGTAVTFRNEHFDPHALWRLVAKARATNVVIVGDAFAKPMLAALIEARDAGNPHDLSSLQQIMSSGVMFSTEVTRGLLEFADIAIIDVMGSTEGSMGSSAVSRALPLGQTARFERALTTKVFNERDEEVQPGSDEVGMIANGGFAPIGYYKDPEKSARTFRVIKGQRYSFPGDFAKVAADGSLILLGRGGVCINTGGEKVFPEEVEEALKAHDSVWDALVVGVPDPRFGDEGRRRGLGAIQSTPSTRRSQLNELHPDTDRRLQDPAQADRGRRGPSRRQRQGRLQMGQGRSPRRRISRSQTMKSPICDMLGIEFPLLAFSHCRDVVAAVSRAGGFGVLGATGHSPESVRIELKWIDDHCDGKPYGIDVLIPENMATAGEKNVTYNSLRTRVPPQHSAFAHDLLEKIGVSVEDRVARDDTPQPFDPDRAIQVLEAAFEFPIRLIANALGVPPPSMVEMGKKHGVPVAALVGAKEHAIRQVNAGVDILVVQGTEAGGHCGEVSTLVLVPEVLKAIKPIRDVPVLAAGGIMTGAQMAACMAMGAAGVWTGSVWLATMESETTEIFREKMIEASSRDAVRSKSRTGKPARQLRSAWTEAWERDPASPGPLPMPLQSLISEHALRTVDRAAAAGNAKARDMVTYFVGQGVGLIDSVRSATQVVQDFKEEFLGKRWNGQG